MFTGIVEEVGRVTERQEGNGLFSLTIEGGGLAAALEEGASLAVSGVCLTVTRREGERFTADVANETARRTTLARLKAGDRVNLELPLRADGRLGGHFVQGHVDGTGRVLAAEQRGGDRVVRVGLPPGAEPYVVEKGSITVDGVSLTVAACGKEWFEVMLIPYTLAATTLGGLDSGHEVNLEYDILAKYVVELARFNQKVEGERNG